MCRDVLLIYIFSSSISGIFPDSEFLAGIDPEQPEIRLELASSLLANDILHEFTIS
jgi:hypothetical protein